MTKFVLLDFSHLFQYKFPSSNYLNIHWKYWCWSWNSNTLATWCQELTHWKRPWYWETLKAGGEGDDRGWDGWMASPTQWAWVWVNSGSWWWTERPGVLQSMGSQRLRHDWATELNWTSNYQFLCIYEFVSILLCLSCLFFFFLDSTYSEIILYLSCSVWFISFSTIPSRSICKISLSVMSE